jgi:hypothetical protein
MATKPKRSWFDIQMAIMTISMASALGLWNLFAGPDRETALRKAAEAQASQPEPVVASPTPETPVINANTAPLPEPGQKIMLGGTAPQTQVIIQTRGGGGGGGGGGGPVTSTKSS